MTDPVTAPQAIDRTVGEPCVLLKLGEIFLKGKNRQQFVRMQQANVRAAVRSTGVPVELTVREGVLVLRVAHGEGEAAERMTAAEHAAAMDRVAARVADVPGIVRVCRALRVDKTPEAAIAAAIALTSPASGTFAVRARRRDKRFPITSEQLNVLIGDRVNAAHGLKVSLKHPDTEIFVEVDAREVFVFTGGQPGQGGLPVGMSGRAVVLMSGGIDSPVAAYRMMRRGLRCTFLHFSGMPLTGPESIYKAYALVRGLDRFQGQSHLYVVPFGKAQQALATTGAGRLQVMAQRRLMLKTAEALAARLHAERPGHRRLPRPGLQPDPDQHHRPRRRGQAADPAPAARLGQDRDHGRGPPPGHPRHLRAPRPGLLHAAHPAPGGDQGEDRRPAPHRDPPGRRRTGRAARPDRPGVPPRVVLVSLH